MIACRCSYIEAGRPVGLPAFVLALLTIGVRMVGRRRAPGAIFLIFMKLTVDGLSEPLIMRPTSSDIGTKNSLNINELIDQEGCGGASIARSAAVKKAVDSRL